MTDTCTLIPPAVTKPEPNRLYPVALYTLAGRCWAWIAFLPPHRAGDRWAWVQAIVAHEHEWDESEVDCIEDEDVGEIVTVRGEPVYILRQGRGAERAPSVVPPLSADSL